MLHFVCITPDPTLGKYGCVWLSSQPVPGLLRIVISVPSQIPSQPPYGFRVSMSESGSVDLPS